ncbi:MAG: hypothetical protein K5798_10530, partial [Nitrosopumilus sp.]|nr:hypothetical protein [Nitrosopumilus sp.]
KIIDEIYMSGIAREHAYFNMYKYGQYLLAENELNQICPECLDGSYDKINDIFSYESPDRVNKLDNEEIQSLMKLEALRAQETINLLLKTNQE